MNHASTPIHSLGTSYWWVVGVAAVMTLARFSEAFLLLRIQQFDVPVFLLPFVLVVMGVAYSLSAYPAGALSDRLDRVTLLQVGLVLLVLADQTLAWAPNLVVAGIGVALWGLHMGFSQGLLGAMVADTAAADLRGTAFGMFNLVTGVALLIASVLAGALWDAIGSSATFLAGAVFAGLALVGLRLVGMRKGRLSAPRPSR